MIERIENYVDNAWLLLLLGPVVLAMFLLGLAAGRHGLIGRATEHEVLLRRIRNWALAVGLPLALLCAAGMDRLPTTSALLCLQLNWVLADPLLALAYGATIIRLWQRAPWQRWLHRFRFGLFEWLWRAHLRPPGAASPNQGPELTAPSSCAGPLSGHPGPAPR